MSVLITAMNDELSLVPKPMRRYRELLDTLQKQLDLFSGLRKIRENIPRQETVTSVTEQRRELVSCVCISLFACEQVIGARRPLPQFLPSASRALSILSKRIEAHIKCGRTERSATPYLSMIFAFAELKAMQALVDNLAQLLEVCKQLFGTASWYGNDASGINTESTMMIGLHEEVRSSAHIECRLL
jgi:hypothetical protein